MAQKKHAIALSKSLSIGVARRKAFLDSRLHQA
jgi:hypothetical protein